MTPLRWLQLIGRVLVGSLAGFIFIPIALIGYLQGSFHPKDENMPEEYRERLNSYQIGALVVVFILILLLLRAIF